MKHHMMVSRMPLKAQTDGDSRFEPGDTSFQSKMNFLVAFFGQTIEFAFNKGSAL